MEIFEKIASLEPYSMAHEEKNVFITEMMKELTLFHREKCDIYARILNAMGMTSGRIADIRTEADIPYLPVRLFKEYELMSIDRSEAAKVITSSGTTGQKTSKIFLDKETSAAQTKVLTGIVGSFLGNRRLPMIIIDASSVVRNRAMFSARAAGINGFRIFGRDLFFALDDNMELDTDGLKAFLEKHSGERLFVFGFTFMIWRHFYETLKKQSYHPDLSNAVMIHGGGWKKLANLKISSSEFRAALGDVCGITDIHDYYGMAEQTGTIYMECEHGHLHTSVFSDVIIRDPFDFSECPFGKQGLIQVMSVLPRSYPGHSLLTEDAGIMLGEDNCPCGRKGKYFSVTGRIKNAELRGCSDTYAAGLG